MAKLEVASLCVSLGAAGRRLLQDVSFTLPAGERYALIGRSGSGKTLCACALSGMLRPPLTVTAGQVLLDGFPLLGQGREAFRQLRGRGIFYLLQNPGAAFSPCRRIFDQIARAAALRRRHDAAESAEQALRMVGLAAQRDCYPFQLSGGMRQRVLIALALALRPAIWIADELTTGLDPLTQSEILDCLERCLDETGASLLFLTHDLRSAGRLCRQAIVLEGGNIVAQGTWESLASGCSPAAAIFEATRRLVP